MHRSNLSSVVPRSPLVSTCKASLRLFLAATYGDGGHLLLGVTATLRPLMKPTIIKKRIKKFIQLQSDQYVKIKCSWQKPRGIDNRVCRRFEGQILTSNTGYGHNKKTKHMLPSGFWQFLVHSVNDLQVLPMSNRSYCAGTAHSVSSHSCKATEERAAQLAFRVTDPNAGLRSEENEETACVHIVFVLTKPYNSVQKSPQTVTVSVTLLSHTVLGLYVLPPELLQ
ncbi:60S ribosomal protein L32-like [Pteronotus mesoamericanus]|uniref:60S ribosomal protein L32-like n=1 Tax=Pteronotus mesoamericanus TaxID=1884717 RepID=UPI0023ED1A5F|nr:60S ribosomal protein L32-like [Pteronotus parnellii mesoamericanus]